MRFIHIRMSTSTRLRQPPGRPRSGCGTLPRGARTLRFHALPEGGRAPDRRDLFDGPSSPSRPSAPWNRSAGWRTRASRSSTPRQPDPGTGHRATGLQWPGGVTVIARGDPVTVPVHDRTGELAGHVTGAGHASAHETTDLSRHLKPTTDARVPQVALLHTQVATAAARQAHHPYAPSTLEHLRSAGFHYWALGHVHLRQELSGDPPIHYSGNLQGRSPRETGPKGGLLVDLGDPARPLVEFREFAPVRWEKLAVSTLADATTLDEVAGEVVRAWEAARNDDPGSEGTEWMVAVELAGPSPIWRQLREPQELETIEDEVAARLGAVGAEVRARVHPKVRVDEHIERRDVLGATLRLCREVAGGGQEFRLAETDLAGFDPERDATVGDYLRRLLAGGEEETLERMLERKGAPQ